MKRPSDGKEPETVVFVACSGSRDRAKGVPYCSKICCMYTAKHAMLYKHKVHHGKAYVFYMDIRSAGKDYDEFVRRAIEEDDVIYLRSRAARIYADGGQLVVQAADTLNGGERMDLKADLVVLASAAVPQADVRTLAQKLGIGYDADGWLSEAHPKLRPVETNTAGIFLAGACQGPRTFLNRWRRPRRRPPRCSDCWRPKRTSARPGRRPGQSYARRPCLSTCIGCFTCAAACPYTPSSARRFATAQGGLLKGRGPRQPRGSARVAGRVFRCAAPSPLTWTGSPTKKFSARWRRSSNE
jgi:heterodisulfide reductase subunit A2